MPQYRKGTVLTCEHADCDCRVRIEEECHCPTGGDSYMCACGAPLVEVAEASAGAPGPV
ncbi:MAG TPA: metallothionein [Pseudonocardiaceae bacterium]|jgi:hypothetical protein|nr:metallothionein [Pseudonocardiaceae bacterium]